MSMMKTLITTLAENLVRETGCSFETATMLLMDGNKYEDCIKIILSRSDSK